MRTWTTLLKIDGGNVFVNRVALAMLHAQLVAGPTSRIVRGRREAVAA